MQNKTTDLEANAKKATKHPKIKRAIQCIKMLEKYGRENWYKYDKNMNIIKYPSQRMLTWAYDLEDFASDIAFYRDPNMDKLWEAYCQVNGIDSAIEVSGYFS